MKHAIIPAILAALVAAAPASAAPGITGHEVDQDSDALTGAEITVSLAGPGAEYVYCDWTQGDTTVRVYLQGSGTEWTGVLPANHAGSAGVRLYVFQRSTERRMRDFVFLPTANSFITSRKTRRIQMG